MTIHTISLALTYSTIYAFSSSPALTRVSVPCTGKAKESIMTIELPTTFPCIMPMISQGTPDRAWMTCVTRKNAMSVQQEQRRERHLTNHLYQCYSRDFACLEVTGPALFVSRHEPQSIAPHAHSFFQGSSLRITLFASWSYLYISSCGETSKISFSSENVFKAVDDEDAMNAGEERGCRSQATRDANALTHHHHERTTSRRKSFKMPLNLSWPVSFWLS